jgi:hypothetical protein
MAFVFGIDEAGYGPRLGPLIVAASGWNVNGEPRTFDFWGKLERVISRQREDSGPDARLHVADSKQVYSASQGLANLERSVLALLAVAGFRPRSFLDLWRSISGGQDPTGDGYLSHEDLTFALPLSAGQADIDAASCRVADELERQCVRLHAIEIDVVDVARFNSLTRFHGSKGATLTQVSLDLLGRCWKPLGDQRMLVLADRHGGRRYYRGSLVEALDGRLVCCVREQVDCSHYRVDQSEFRFETGGERHFPVAVASMCAKYLRELMMESFNRFWIRQVPGLRATKGYPADAGRFRRDIAPAQSRLGILDEVLWRIR